MSERAGLHGEAGEETHGAPKNATLILRGENREPGSTRVFSLPIHLERERERAPLAFSMLRTLSRSLARFPRGFTLFIEY